MTDLLRYLVFAIELAVIAFAIYALRSRKRSTDRDARLHDLVNFSIFVGYNLRYFFLKDNIVALAGLMIATGLWGIYLLFVAWTDSHVRMA